MAGGQLSEGPILPTDHRPLPPLRRFLRFRSRVSLEHSRRREFSQLVPDHVLGHKDRNVPFAVVNAKGQPDHLRRYRRASRPGLDRRRLRPAIADTSKRFLNAQVDERSFLK